MHLQLLKDEVAVPIIYVDVQQAKYRSSNGMRIYSSYIIVFHSARFVVALYFMRFIRYVHNSYDVITYGRPTV